MGSHTSTICAVLYLMFTVFVMVAWWWSFQAETRSHSWIEKVAVFDGTITIYFTVYLRMTLEYMQAGRSQSVQRLATAWTVQGSNPEGGGAARFSAPVQTDPGAHPASYTMGTGSFPGVKRPGRGVEHPLPYSAEAEEREELHIYSDCGLRGLFYSVKFTLPNLQYTSVICLFT